MAIPVRPDYGFSDLKALFLNCTLKASPQPSHTQGLMEAAAQLMRSEGASVDIIRVLDYHLAPGIKPDMTQHGAERDDWPQLFEKVLAADILVLGTPIWLGEKSSVCQQVIERLYSNSGQLNEAGQSIYYNKVAGCLITGNEDGIKHCAMGMLYSLQHIGYTVPPQADAGWIGEAGPGLSYMNAGSGGPQNDFTNRNTAIMCWNLLHMARLLKDSPIHPYGNDRQAYKAGETFGFIPPAYWQE